MKVPAYWLPVIPIYIAALVLGFLLLYTTEHGEVVLWLNDRHTSFGDVFFKWITHLGDGLFLVAIALILLFVRRRYGWILGLAGIVQAIISYVLKFHVYPHESRPKRFFKDQDVVLNFVEGVNVHGGHAFPSGHTMTAFMLAVFLAYYFKKVWISGALLLLAILVACSRMYILQHFLIDVVFGSIWGVGLGLLTIRLFRQYLNEEPRNQ